LLFLIFIFIFSSLFPRIVISCVHDGAAFLYSSLVSKTKHRGS